MDYRNLHLSTVAELRAIAREKKIKLAAGMNKQHIIQAILSWEAEQAKPVPAPAPAEPAEKPVQSEQSADEEAEAPKRRRGRPRKNPLPEEQSAPEKPVQTQAPQLKKTRAAATKKAEPKQVEKPEEQAEIKQPARRGRHPKSDAQAQPREAKAQDQAPAQPAEIKDSPKAPEAPVQQAETNKPAASPAFSQSEGTAEKPREIIYPFVRRPENVRPAVKPTAPVQQETTAQKIEKTEASESTEERKPSQPTAAPTEPVQVTESPDAAGVLDIHPDGYGFLRAENYAPGPKDTYISIAQIRRFNLREGDFVEGKTRPQREGDRYNALIYINRINGDPPEAAIHRKPFDTLVPIFPNERLRLEDPEGNSDMALRIIDMLAPIGKGQRGMIVSPPKAGKTTLLKKVANALTKHYPEIHLIVLLIDERPEEVTDMKRSIDGEVVYSTFDEEPENHTRISEMVLERAQRMVEQGKDVVLLLDSITRLARAYNLTIPPTGRSLSGGLDPGALYRPKHFFGAARNIEFGGSLTIIATALVDTGSRLDDIIYEEFKGTGNMELQLDRKLSDRRVFPAIDLVKSGTRRDDLLMTPEEIYGAGQIRRMLAGSSQQNNAEQLLQMMEKTSSNEEFFRLLKNVKGVYERDGYTFGSK